MNIHPSITARLDKFISMSSIPHIIFHGASGSGKRTIMNNFIKKVYSDNANMIKEYVMYVNCAQGKGIRFIREDLKHFAKSHINTHGGKMFKSIVLMNADKLTTDAQSALRRCIEVFSHNTRFFMVVDDKHKLLKPILSRFCDIYVPNPVIDGVRVNLHTYLVDETFSADRPDRYRMKNIRALLYVVKRDPTVESVRHCVATLYDQAVCTADVIASLQAINKLEVDNCLQCDVLFRYNEIKQDFRCEQMALFFLLSAFFLRLTTSLENMPHM